MRERMVTIDVKESIPALSAGVLTRRNALNTIACDYRIHCFVEAVRRHDRAKRPWRQRRAQTNNATQSAAPHRYVPSAPMKRRGFGLPIVGHASSPITSRQRHAVAATINETIARDGSCAPK